MTFIDLVGILMTQDNALSRIADDPRFAAHLAAFTSDDSEVRRLLEVELPEELRVAGLAAAVVRYRLVGDWLRKEAASGETEGESLSARQVYERYGYRALEVVEQLAAFDVTARR